MPKSMSKAEIKAIRRTFRRVQQHLLSLKLPKSTATRFATCVVTWVEKSGHEWTAKRLQSLKTALMDGLTKEGHYIVPPGWATRKNRKGEVIFKDELIHRIFSERTQNLMRALAVIRIATLIRLPNLSAAQREKMVKAIASPLSVPLDPLLSSFQTLNLRPIALKFRQQLEEIGLTSKTLMDHIGERKSGPLFREAENNPKSWIYAGSYTRQEKECFTFESYFTRDRELSNLSREFPKEVSSRLLGVLHYPFAREDVEENDEVPCGTIITLQEGACKLRWIANPILAIQVLGEPLKDKLYAYLREAYPEVRTHDQDSGRLDVLGWLQEGRVVYSYDCTSFTDRFPLKLQENLLLKAQRDGIATEFDVRSFDLVMRKSWYCPSLKGMLRWEVGQPLGYGPSFHIATLSHAVILDSLDTERTRLWRVVGDDVVIADSNLAKAYQEYMTTICGVEINTSKSVISGFYAEFLGKLISKEKGIIPSMKVKFVEEADQVVELMKFYGPAALSYLEKGHKGYALKCFLPPYLGGLGLLPKSLTYAEYLSSLKTGRLQQKVISDTVKDFHGSIPYGVTSGTESYVRLKVSILEDNTSYLDLLGSNEMNRLFGQVVGLNAMTGLPILAEDVMTSVCSQADHATNTWIYLQDKAWLLQNISNSPVQTTGEKSSARRRRGMQHDLPLLNKWGYVNSNESPSTLSSTELSHLPLIFDRKSNNDSQYQDYRQFFVDFKEFQKGLEEEGWEFTVGPDCSDQTGCQ